MPDYRGALRGRRFGPGREEIFEGKSHGIRAGIAMIFGSLARGLALAWLLFAISVSAQVPTSAAKQFFRAYDSAGGDHPQGPPGVVSGGLPIQLNMPVMLAMRPGEQIQLTLPNAISRPVVFELALSHGGGINSWVGHFRQGGKNNRVIITTGPTGSYGVIDTPDGSYRVIPGGGGYDWLVDMTQEQLHIPPPPTVDDTLIPPPQPKSAQSQPHQASLRLAIPGVNTVAIGKSTPAPQAVVGLMVVVTQTLANRLGSNLMTRLYFLITRANTTYADSGIAITLRLVKLGVLDYSDHAPEHF